MEVEANFGSQRLVHLDLKRSPIKVEFLEKFFPLIKSWGCTGLLIEWEDTFPYSGRLFPIGSANTESKAYTIEDVDKIHNLAEMHSLSVVPLVQTFGHLEFVLKHQEFMEMREVSSFPNSLCPSHPGSVDLVTTMIDQIVAKLPKSTRYFHIGADEVWHLGVCSSCCDQDRNLVLFNHLTSVLRHIHNHYPNLRPIMWDDMLRTIDHDLLKGFNLGSVVDIMIWIYEPQSTFLLSDDLWNKYMALFPSIWIASAYKGATGSSQILPLTRHHVSNHEAWLAHLNKKAPASIEGIAFTGWSRYDHYATLCDLLPVAIPCLALCLRVWLNRAFTESIVKQVGDSLGYLQVPLQLFPYPRPQPVAAELNFPGWKACVGVEWLGNLKAKHHNIVSSEQVSTWLNPWQIRKNFTNPMHIQGLVTALFELCREWEALEIYMTTHLAEVYYNNTIDEWIYTQVHSCKQAAKQLHASGEKQLNSGNKMNNSNVKGIVPIAIKDMISQDAMVAEEIAEEMNDNGDSNLDMP